MNNNTIRFNFVLNNNEVTIDLKDYNQQLNIWIEGNEQITNERNWDTVRETEYYQFVLCKDNLGFIHYGAISKEDDYNHEAGYMWSSRCSVFNQFVPQMTEAVYNRESIALPIEIVADIAARASEVSGETIVMLMDDRDGEISYKLVSLDRQEHELIGKEVM